MNRIANEQSQPTLGTTALKSSPLKCPFFCCFGRNAFKAMKILLLTFVLLSEVQLASAKKSDPPRINIEAAIQMARDYVVKEAIAHEGYSLWRAEYLNMYNEYEEAHWNIRWEQIPQTRGPWFEVKIYQNKEIKVVYGK